MRKLYLSVLTCVKKNNQKTKSPSSRDFRSERTRPDGSLLSKTIRSVGVGRRNRIHRPCIRWRNIYIIIRMCSHVIISVRWVVIKKNKTIKYNNNNLTVGLYDDCFSISPGQNLLLSILLHPRPIIFYYGCCRILTRKNSTNFSILFLIVQNFGSRFDLVSLFIVLFFKFQKPGF